MSLDELLDPLYRRLDEYRRSGDACGILSEEVLVEARQAWEEAQPATADLLTPGQHQRVKQVRHVLGWLHYLRSTALPDGPDRSEFARALLLLEPIADNPEAIPEPLHSVLGPAATPDAQADLSADLLDQALATADPTLFDASISLLTTFIGTTAQDHPSRVGMLFDLGAAHRLRYERTRALDDLDRAIENCAQAVAAAHANHPDRTTYLGTLGGAYRARYDHTGVLEDLDQAIEMHAQAVAATHPDDPDRARDLLSLSNAYHFRHLRTGVVDDLDRAIEMYAQATAATHPDDPDRAGDQLSLGIACYRRYLHRGVLKDLDRAIVMFAHAVAAHSDQAGYLLGEAYGSRYQHTGALEDLDRAIEARDRVVSATHPDHPDRTRHLASLGRAYHYRYLHTRVPEDLDRAIEAMDQVASATRPDRGESLGDLLYAYQLRYERTGALEDLDRMIEATNQGLAAGPADDSTRVLMLISVALSYQSRLDAGAGGVDPDLVRVLAKQLELATTASPLYRVEAGFAVGSLAHSIGEDRVAAELLDAAVALLPSIPPRESGWADQEHRLGRHSGLVADAVGAHCAIDDPVGAVETAELGRAILLATHLDSRTDLSDLAAAHPELASRFRVIREHLDPPYGNSHPDDRGQDRIEDRKRLWAEHDALLDQIRQHPGFARFLLPPRLADLQPVAAGGAVVLVNASRRRSDAIIMTVGADPLPVELPDLTLNDVRSQTAALLNATTSPLVAAVRKQRVFPQVLTWLWDTTVAPILAALPAPVVCGESLPRVWWMPTGRLGLLPFHAAGRPGQPGALDTVVSSYTPTLRALIHTRARPAALSRRQLTVALHHTPDLPDLPGAVVEASDLHARHPDTPFLLDRDATTHRVLAALHGATWAHFACHASIDFTAPSRSALHLHDGSLSIPDISRLHLDHAELAYLSACSTGGRGWQHADESLHLASAFQLAGFRHVVASLWPLDDHTATTAARSFYNHLPTTPTADTAAHALHRVTLDLRASRPDRPDLWAPLIHSGP